MASFNELPFELQYEVIVQAMKARFTPGSGGSSRVMRLRLVSKTVAAMVDDALLTVSIITDSLQLERLARTLPPASVYKLLARNPLPSYHQQALCLTAKTLFDEMDMSGNDTLGSLVGSLQLFSLSKRNRYAGNYYASGTMAPSSPSLADTLQPWERNRLLSLLAAAAYLNCIPVTKRLVDMGICSWHNAVLLGEPSVAAALQGNNEILKVFLKNETDIRAPVKRSALFAAITNGNIGTLDLILDPQWGEAWIRFWKAGTHPSRKTFEHCIFAALMENSSVAMYTRVSDLLGDYEDYESYCYVDRKTTCSPDRIHQRRRAYFLACAAGNSYESLTRHLLDLGAPASGDEPIPTSPLSPLWNATNTGSIETVRLLLERCAQPPKQSERWAIAPLYNAVVRGDLEMVKLLVPYHADINRGTNGADLGLPLIVIALQLEHTAMFRFLLEQGAVLKSRMVTRLAFHVTAKAGLESMARLLLDERLVPTFGCVKTAIASGNLGIAEMLRPNVPVDVDTAFEETGEIAWLDFEGSY
ncbi:ankyrin repeat-containing domain protein [Rhexocercosporidium sp. MPI-PUGE-AT-0058]|nr:ankyrin repeat-containing domain protein [Rhexocercosporidium sp. MPI-PUGE-AT-0058]